MNDPQPAQHLFEALGESAETLQWTGRPRQGIIFREFDRYNIVAFLVVISFWALMRIFVFHSTTISNAISDGAIALLLGAAAPVLQDAYLRKHTWYALTKDSALFVRTGLGAKTDSVYLPSLAAIDFSAGENGFGAIRFRHFLPESSEESHWFKDIANASEVYQRCLAAQAASGQMEQAS